MLTLFCKRTFRRLSSMCFDRFTPAHMIQDLFQVVDSRAGTLSHDLPTSILLVFVDNGISTVGSSYEVEPWIVDCWIVDWNTIWYISYYRPTAVTLLVRFTAIGENKGMPIRVARFQLDYNSKPLGIKSNLKHQTTIYLAPTVLFIPQSRVAK